MVSDILNKLDIEYTLVRTHNGLEYSSVFKISETEDICLKVYPGYYIEMFSVSMKRTLFPNTMVFCNIEDLELCLQNCLIKINEYVNTQSQLLH